MDYRIVTQLPDGQYGYLPHYKRMTSEYLRPPWPWACKCGTAKNCGTPGRTRPRRRHRDATPQACLLTSGRFESGVPLHTGPPTTAARC